MNNNIPYEETSAINGKNIEESFMKIAKHLLLHQLSTQDNPLLQEKTIGGGQKDANNSGNNNQFSLGSARAFGGQSIAKKD